MLSPSVRRFLAERRIGHLATSDHRSLPHVVPVCFAAAEGTIYITVDEKPKGRAPLKRLRNIIENPAAAFVVDRYDEDWAFLGWVMIRGTARILPSGAEHDEGAGASSRAIPPAGIDADRGAPGDRDPDREGDELGQPVRGRLAPARSPGP